MLRIQYEMQGGDETALYKISTFITKLVSGGDLRNYATGSCTCLHVGASRVSGEVTIRGWSTDNN